MEGHDGGPVIQKTQEKCSVARQQNRERISDTYIHVHAGKRAKWPHTPCKTNGG